MFGRGEESAGCKPRGVEGCLAYGTCQANGCLEKRARKNASRALMAQSAWTQQLAVKAARALQFQEKAC